MALRLAATALLVTVAAAAGVGARASEIRSERDQTLYAIGARLGRSLAPFSLSAAELEMVLRGLRDAVLGRELAVNETAQQDRIDALLRERRSVSLETERAASAELLEHAAREPGAVRTPSGLVMVACARDRGPPRVRPTRCGSIITAGCGTGTSSTARWSAACRSR